MCGHWGGEREDGHERRCEESRWTHVDVDDGWICPMGSGES
jgi:hypothetical protein